MCWFPRLLPRVQHPEKKIEQRYRLEDCNDTDYGTVNEDGVYDVDDNVYLKLVGPNNIVKVNTAWRTDEKDDIAIPYVQRTHKV